MIKKRLTVLAIAILLIGGGWYGYDRTRPEGFGGGGFAVGAATNVFGTSPSSPIFIATTTDSGSVFSTSTSDAISIGYETDLVDLDLHVVASSTTSEVNWQYEFSDDGTNWYSEDVKSVAGSTVTHQPASTTHVWIPGVTVPVARNVGISDLNSKYFRVRVFRGANSAGAANNFSLWLTKAVKANQ